MLVIVAGVSAQSSWRMGVTLGMLGNHSKFSGGMSNASALFNPNPYGSGALGLVFRKTINSHLSFQTGLNFGSLGFEYAMAHDYSLVRPQGHYLVNRVGLGIASIPATMIWNFNPNCRNVRWFVGGGLSLVMHGNKNADKSVASDPDKTGSSGLNGNDYISQNVTSNSFAVLNGHFMFGAEKLLKKGGMLSLACYFNGGFSPVATSHVTYSVGGVLYDHTFTNYNHTMGLMLTYYFKNFKSTPKPIQNAAR